MLFGALLAVSGGARGLAGNQGAAQGRRWRAYARSETQGRAILAAMPEIPLQSLILQLQPWWPLPAGVAALVLVLLAFAWLLLSVTQLRRAQSVLAEALAERLEPLLEAQHRQMLGNLHLALERQGDRLNSHSAEAAERVKVRISSDLQGCARLCRASSFLRRRRLPDSARKTLRLAELGTAIASRQESCAANCSRRCSHDPVRTRAPTANCSKVAFAAPRLSCRPASSRSRAPSTKGSESISGRVSERLDEGFRKTNETFVSVMARLATIDEAQKKIDGLTTNVVSLQELLGDKRRRAPSVKSSSRPLSQMRCRPMPTSSRLRCRTVRGSTPAPASRADRSGGGRPKFPLENYHRMFDGSLGDLDRRSAQNAFRSDVRKHVDAIASKYLLPGVTSDGR